MKPRPDDLVRAHSPVASISRYRNAWITVRRDRLAELGLEPYDAGTPTWKTAEELEAERLEMEAFLSRTARRAGQMGPKDGVATHKVPRGTAPNDWEPPEIRYTGNKDRFKDEVKRSYDNHPDPKFRGHKVEFPNL